jgi:hypothetical protein
VTFYARRNKAGDRVLCGACNRPIARIGPGRFVFFEVGWQPRPGDDVWTLSRHSLRSMLAGFGAQFRDLPVRGSIVQLMKDRGMLPGRMPESLPIEAVCAYAPCGQRQLLDATVLHTIIGSQEDFAQSVEIGFKDAHRTRLIHLYERPTLR